MKASRAAAATANAQQQQAAEVAEINKRLDEIEKRLASLCELLQAQDKTAAETPKAARK